MRKVLIGVLFIFFLSVFSNLAEASIFTCNSTGVEKTSFYSNESVYVTSNTSITTNATSVKFYIATHRTWSAGANLTTAANISIYVSTNSTGHVPITLLWSPTLIIGTYDVIADVNNNSTFDAEDQLYTGTGSGFSVLQQLAPTLVIIKGAKSPPDHDWHVELNGSQKNVMLQINLTAGSYDAVKVNSFALLASGSGDDKNGIHLVALYYDANGNGIYDEGDSLFGFGQYSIDDGVATIDTDNKLTIAASSTVTLIFVYTMTNSSGSATGSTYVFQLASIDGVGVNTGTVAKVSGLLYSAVKTVYSSASTTTTISANTTTSPTTTEPIATTTTVPENETKDLFVGLSVAGVAVAVILVFVYYFFLRPPQPYHYTPQ